MSRATAMLMASMAFCWLIQPVACAAQATRNGSGTRTALNMIRERSQDRL